jgi:hypothetical protein
MHSDLNTSSTDSSPDELARLNTKSILDKLDPRMSIREALAWEWDAELLFLSEEEFDEAILGVSERIGDEPVVAYDKEKILDILSNSMTADEAWEYFEFNILGAYVGEKTPVFITRCV